MNPSFLLLRSSLSEAMARYGAWLGAPEIAPPREVDEREAIDLALDGDQWRGLAVYIFSAEPWTVFEEISGGLAGRQADEWLLLADGGDLIYAGYNDAIGYAEFVRVDGGRLVRHFHQNEQERAAPVNVGRLPEEGGTPWVHWADVAGWVDERLETFRTGERGWLWIHRVS